MKNLNKILLVVVATALGYLSMAGSVFADFGFGTFSANDAVNSLNVDATIGSATSLVEVLTLIVNILKYVGWAGVIVGVVAIVALLVFKLISTDSEETMKTVQGGITKAVVIILIGILLTSAGFLFTVITDLTGDSGGGDGSVATS